MKTVIANDHWISGVEREPLPGRGAMKIRRYLVIHYTSGASAGSSIDFMRRKKVSAHIVIDRDGSVIQCVPFNQVAYHAGGPGMARWRDPKDGALYNGANACSIGIELANFGNEIESRMKWTDLPLLSAKHRNESMTEKWETFPQPQLDVCFSISAALVQRYNLDDITGHDCIAPERKNDPGPAFPMQALREACGFTGLPQVHKRA